MQLLNQLEYYTRREGEQRASAGRTQCQETASFHAMLADRYAGLAREAQKFGTRMDDRVH